MKRTIAIAVLILLAGADLALAQSNHIFGERRRFRPRLMEGGFQATEIPECGSLGEYDARRWPNDLKTYMEIADVECSPGGAWGPYIYLSEQRRSDPRQIRIERISFQGEAESFALVATEGRTGTLSFAPPGWRNGDQVQVLTVPDPFDPSVHSSGYTGYSPDGQIIPGGFMVPGAWLGPMAIDPTGFYDYDQFWIQGLHLYRRDAAGTVSVFASYVTSGVGFELRWGPGGDWGTDLYYASQVIAPDGTVTAFPSSFEEFDWAEGEGFDGDMFDLDVQFNTPDHPPNQPRYNLVHRIKPDGSRTLFAKVTSTQMVACDGALWFVGRGCWVVRPAAGNGKGPGKKMETRRHAAEP